MSDMIYERSVLIPQLEKYNVIEERIWSLTQENVEECINFIKGIDPNLNDYSLQVVIKAGTLRSKYIKLYARLFEAFPPTNRNFPNCLFTQYLVKRNLLPISRLLTQELTDKSVEDIEGVFPVGTIGYYIVQADYDRILQISSEGGIDFQQKVPYEGIFELSLLDICAYACHKPEIFEFFLQNGLKITHQTLEVAIYGGNTIIINLIRKKNFSFDNCLHVAVLSNNFEMCKYVLEQFKCENITLEKCLNDLNSLAFSYFLAKGQSIQENALQLLQEATRNGALEVIKFLVSKGVDPKMLDDNNSSPLNIAAENGFLSVVQYYVSCDISIETRTSSGMTAISFAAKAGQVSVIEYLIEKGAILNHQDESKNTPLILAVINDRLDAVKLLVEKGGVSFHSKNGHDWDAVMFAAKYARFEILEYFISKGCTTKNAKFVAEDPKVRKMLNSARSNQKKK